MVEYPAYVYLIHQAFMANAVWYCENMEITLFIQRPKLSKNMPFGAIAGIYITKNIACNENQWDIYNTQLVKDCLLSAYWPNA